MKISELVLQLIDTQEKMGDLDVHIIIDSNLSHAPIESIMIGLQPETYLALCPINWKELESEHFSESE